LYGQNGYAAAAGVLGQSATLWAGNCSINLANSRLSTPSGNPKALVLTLNITFPDQAYLTTQDTDIVPEFVGPHEVYAWGTSAEGLATGQVDLGSLVVSQGQDFTLQVAPGGVISMGPGATQILTLTATGLNGFNGSIALSRTLQQGSVCFAVTSAPSSMLANSQASIVVQNYCSSSESGLNGYLFINGSAIGLRRGITNGALIGGVNLVTAAGGDISVGVGIPSPAVLRPQGSVTYPVTVSSVNGQAGYVNLSVSSATSLPAGVSYGFSAPQVYLSGWGSTATSYLTVNSSASTPPGSYILLLNGQLASPYGSPVRSASFALSTQVNTFQVTSVTGSAIVHNTGQEVQVTHNVPAGNAPTFTTCDTADPSVTCRVISTSASTVTLGITAGTSAVHGTRVLSLNGGRAAVHAAIADAYGRTLGNLSPSSIQAGAPPTFGTLSISGMNQCESGSICDPEVIVDGPVEADMTTWSTNSISLILYADASTPGGSYGVWVNLCGGYWDAFDDPNSTCLVGPAFLQVIAAPCNSPTVSILSRPIQIQTTATPWLYTATLTSYTSPIGGTYQWTTSNPWNSSTNTGMVEFTNGVNAAQVTLLIHSTNDKATITLTYRSPCGATAADSFTFALGNDTTVVAWVDGNQITPPDPTPLGPNDPIAQDLSYGLLSCANRIYSWRDSGKRGFGVGTNGLTSAEILFANQFLIHGSANYLNRITGTYGTPPAQMPADQGSFINAGDYRLYQRFQAYYELTASGGISSAKFIGPVQALTGTTPEPCTGLQLLSLPVETNSLNGQYKLTSDGTLVYQVNEARVGSDGQAVNQFLNGPAGGDFTTTTPWIWSVIQFDANGKTQAWTQGGTSNNIGLFPAYQVYTNGFAVPPIAKGTQGNLATFTGLNSTFQYKGPL